MVCVAGIDQSRNGFGWAIGSDEDGAIPRWGVDNLSAAGKNEGLMYSLAAKRVRQLIAEGAQKVFFERPIKLRTDRLETDLITVGIPAIIMHVCHEKGVPCAWVGVDDWRSRFLGFHKPPPGVTEAKARRAWYKETAIQQCLARGWLVQDDNAAEALGILDYGLSCVSVPYRKRVGPVIRRAQLRRLL